MPNLHIGQLTSARTVFYTRDGDVNQEDTTNRAILVWRSMPRYHFSLTDNPGIDHFSLPSDPALLARLAHHAELAT